MQQRMNSCPEFEPNHPRGEANSPYANRLSPQNAPRSHILIIEDNPDGRETLRLLLQCMGHQVEAAADGVQGVEKALDLHPDIAVVDIGLPGLNGYEVARKLREELGRRIFLIALTAYGQPDDRDLSREAGFDVHLVKPVDLDELNRWSSIGRARIARQRS